MPSLCIHVQPTAYVCIGCDDIFRRRTIQYNDLSNRTHTFSYQSASNEHQKKVTLLMYFAEYMDTHLIAGGNVQTNGSSSINSTSSTSTTVVDQQQTTTKEDHATAIFMKKWFRTDRAIVMYLTNGTLQVYLHDEHGYSVTALHRRHLQDCKFTIGHWPMWTFVCLFVA